MANVNRPVFVLIGTISGSPINGNVRKRQMTCSTAIFPGDAVKLDDATGLVAPAAAGDTLLGVCVGPVVDRSIVSTEHPGYASASSGAYILVAEGPAYLYGEQEGASGTALTVAAVGSNEDIVATAGSTPRGTSGHIFDRSPVTDGSPVSAQLRLIDVVNRVDNELGDYCKWVVRINEHSHRELTGL